jgi:hypothetical protein
MKRVIYIFFLIQYQYHDNHFEIQNEVKYIIENKEIFIYQIGLLDLGCAGPYWS